MPASEALDEDEAACCSAPWRGGIVRFFLLSAAESNIFPLPNFFFFIL